jgi:hypothetical protein
MNRTGGLLLPQLDPSSGFLPIGRHTATFGEVEGDFVASPRFAQSSTRASLWANLRTYLATWNSVWDELSAQRPDLAIDRWLHALWLGGSFISDRVDPRNIDLTLFTDGDAVAGCKGVPGAGKIVKLSNRDSALKHFQISPIVVQHEQIVSPFQPSQLTPRQREYLMLRGGFDEWWLRARPQGAPRGAPTLETVQPARGYVEVLL